MGERDIAVRTLPRSAPGSGICSDGINDRHVLGSGVCLTMSARNTADCRMAHGKGHEDTSSTDGACAEYLEDEQAKDERVVECHG